MNLIERERQRIGAAIVNPGNAGVRDQLYAAQQALAWAVEPASAKAPYDMIMGIPGEQEDCQDEYRPPLTHLHRYCDEFSFRWDERKVTDGERTVEAIKGAAGKRLVYKEAVA